MNAAFTIGRIALVVIFIISGATKFLDISGTADAIQAKLVIPPALSDVTSQIEATLNMPIWQVLAILVALIEVVGGLLIAFNVLTRTMAVILLLFSAAVTVTFHDFWNLPAGADRVNQMTHAMKNLSIMGALLMLAALPRRPVLVDIPTHERVADDRVEPL
jgi:putative oxidoreductase